MATIRVREGINVSIRGTDDVIVPVLEHTPFDPDHWVVKEHPEWFQRDESSPVEEATANPGQRRNR